MEIKLNNKTLKVSYNLATEMAYESLTGDSINYSDIFKREEDKFNQQQLINITVACLTANNSDSFDVGDLIKNENRSEVLAAIEAVIKAMNKWLVVPTIAEKHVKTTDDEGDQSPNE